jgi:cobalt-zinc-cadmium efflux system membrane fusion protein
MTQQDVKGTEAKPLKGMARKTQGLIVALLLALILAGFVVGPAAISGLVAQPKEQPPAAPGADSQAGNGQWFKPTDSQWKGLTLRQAVNEAFQDATATDGRIAIDDDLVTPVFSPYSGHVTKLIAKPGDDVKKGDPLFAIQATELAQAQNDLIAAVSTWRTSKAQLVLAETNEKRQHALYQAQGAALKDWQQSQVDLANAQGNQASAAIALAAVRSRMRILGKTDQDIAGIETSTDLLSIDADTMVRAPISGTVTQRQIGLGQNIVSASSGASSPVFLIGDLSKVWLIANVREEDVPLLHMGDRAEVTVLAIPSKTFNARLTYIGASIDPNTHRLPVRAEVENPRGELKPEMLAGFRIIVGEDATSPAVPQAALVYEGASAHVWVANPADKTLAIRPVKVGRLKASMVEILDGLKAGETVVAAGAVFIDRAASGD